MEKLIEIEKFSDNIFGKYFSYWNILNSEKNKNNRRNLPVVKLLYEDVSENTMKVVDIFGRYSRSKDPTEELMKHVDDINENDSNSKNKERYKKFIEKWIKEFKHNSLAEHPQIFFYVEDISNVATKILEQHDLIEFKIPVAYMEKSTRYVDFSGDSSKKVYIDPAIADNEDLIKEFNEIINFEINGYNEFKKFLEDYSDIVDIPKEDSRRKVIFDQVRYLLFGGVPTLVGCSLNAKSCMNVITSLLTEEEPEAIEIGLQLKLLVNSKFPYMFNRVDDIDNISKTNYLREHFLSEIVTNMETNSYNILYDTKYYNDVFDDMIDDEPNCIFNYLSKPSKEAILNDNLFNETKLSSHRLLYDPNIYTTDNVDVEKQFRSQIHIFNGVKKMFGKIESEYIPKGLKPLKDMKFVISTDYGSFRDVSRHRNVRIQKNNRTYNTPLNRGDSIDFYAPPIMSLLVGMKQMFNSNKEDKEFFDKNSVVVSVIEKMLEKIHTLLTQHFEELIKKINKFYHNLVNYIYNNFDKTYYYEYYLELFNGRKQSNAADYYKLIKSYNMSRNIISYLMPFASNKRFMISGNILDLIHIVNERQQKAGHPAYIKVAEELGEYMGILLNMPRNTLFSELKDESGVNDLTNSRSAYIYNKEIKLMGYNILFEKTKDEDKRNKILKLSGVDEK